MATLSFLVSAAVAGILVPVGYVLAQDFYDDAPSPGGNDIRIETDPGRYEPGQPVRIYLRNVGDDELEGSPRILVMTTEGAMRQTFSLGNFHLSLDPGDAVWVEWLPGPQPTPYPCSYGRESSSGGDSSYPCPMDGASEGWTSESAAGAPSDDAGAPMYYCEGCPVQAPPPMAIVGLFGGHADAMVLEPSPRH